MAQTRAYFTTALGPNPKTIVQFMAWPGPGGIPVAQRGEAGMGYLTRGLEYIAADPFWGGVEVTHIKSAIVRQQVKEWFASHPGLMVLFSAQPVQLLNEDGIVSPGDISDPDEVARRLAVERLTQLIDEALELGADQFAFISGRDPGPDRRGLARAALTRSIVELAEYSRRRVRERAQAAAQPGASVPAAPGEAAATMASAASVRPLRLTLELFDRRSTPGCKGLLVGPASEAAELARQLREVHGITEFGLLYDASHMLLAGDSPEQAESPDALRLVAPYLNHVHIGTCVLDPQDPLVGDSHPGFDYAGSAVSAELLAGFVRTLVDIDYRGPIGFEVKPVGAEEPEALVLSTKAHFLAAASRPEVVYSLGSFAFTTRRYFPEALLARLTQARWERGNAFVEKVAAARRRRARFAGEDGKLVILAADHPARKVLRVGSDPLAMGDRLEYLGRTVRVVASPWVDGVMATTDVLEDLLILDGLAQEAGLTSFLNDKVLIGSLNRTGLAGLDYEMDDRVSSFTARRLVELGLDGAKFLFRLDQGPYSRYSLQTMYYLTQAMNECHRAHLPVFLEPLPVERTDRDQGYRTVLEAGRLIEMVGVAAAMGEASGDLWLKIPYVDGYEDVVRATTLPILMLGGESREDPLPTLLQFERGMAAGPNVRGAMVGRNVLFPGRDDPAAVAAAVYRLVHQEASLAEALLTLRQERGQKLDLWQPLLPA